MDDILASARRGGHRHPPTAGLRRMTYGPRAGSAGPRSPAATRVRFRSVSAMTPIPASPAISDSETGQWRFGGGDSRGGRDRTTGARAGRRSQAPDRQPETPKRRRNGGGRRRFGWRDDGRRGGGGRPTGRRHYSLVRRRPGEAARWSARASGPGSGPRASRTAELKRGEIQDDQRSQRHDQGPQRVHRSDPLWPSAGAVPGSCGSGHRIAIVRRSGMSCDG
jgi:hypothetical protein